MPYILGILANSIHDPPGTAFTITQNPYSRSFGMGVLDGPEYAVTCNLLVSDPNGPAVTHSPFVDFRSDNTGRAAPELIAALSAANTGSDLGYGGDALTAQLQQRFTDLFKKPVRVFPVPTGTAANALSLAAACTPFGAVYCSADAHINTSECNATSFFGGGTKMVPIAGAHGKIDPQALEAAIASAGIGLPHKSQPAAVNLVQATEKAQNSTMDGAFDGIAVTRTDPKTILGARLFRFDTGSEILFSLRVMRPDGSLALCTFQEARKLRNSIGGGDVLFGDLAIAGNASAAFQNVTGKKCTAEMVSF